MRGNTVVVIEHNLDVIKCSDHIIDLGPEGGDKGGTILCTGTPKEICLKCKFLYRTIFKKDVIIYVKASILVMLVLCKS